jgi:subtilase family serine protease
MRRMFLTLILVPAIGFAAPRQLIHSRSTMLMKLNPTGELPPTSRLDLVIGLPLRNTTVLDALLGELYDPNSANFHRFLTPTEFADRFGPTEQEYETLVQFARSAGLTVRGTHPNRTLLDVSGSVADVQRIFAVHLNVFSHPTEQRFFYAPDAEPSVELGIPILTISGLDNFTVPKPMNVRTAKGKENPRDKPNVGTAPGGSYLGSDFRKAYVPGTSLTGVNQTVGLLQFDGFYPQDITAYEALASLPNVPIQTVLLDGVSGAPSTNVNGVLEVSLDIEMAISMAPGLAQIIVYEGTKGNDILNRMATDNIAAQLSASWTYGVDSSTDNIFKQFAAQGQTYFNSSGDGDEYPGAPGTPTDNPFVTTVGGTVLTTTVKGAWTNEVVWNSNDGTNGSSGGISTTYALPTWQKGIDMSNNGGSTANRNLPDVAMVASGVCTVDNNGTTNSGIGGTSVATPLWAAFIALANEQAAQQNRPRIGFLNPTLYALGRGQDYPAVFHDITVGNNTNRFNTGRFFAQPGYDLCTGWGSPTGTNLLNELASFSGAVWVDFNAVVNGDGSYERPYWTLALGVAQVPLAGTVAMKGPSNWPYGTVISKAMTLRAANGVITIGQ